MTKNQIKQVLAISSEVGVGDVGLSIARFAFGAQHVSTIALPSVLFACRPDMGKIVRHPIAASFLDEQLTALKHDGLLQNIEGVLTGYFAHAEQVFVVARHLEKLASLNRDIPILIDPILGDFDTGFYVDLEVAVAVRDVLLPLADVITPNLFEFLWLAGEEPVPRTQVDVDFTELKQGRSKLPVKNVVVTSAARLSGDETTEHKVDREGERIATALFEKDDLTVFNSAYFEDVPKGTGDVFAAHLLSSLILGHPLNEGVNETVRALEEIADKAKGFKTIAPYLLS